VQRPRRSHGRAKRAHHGKRTKGASKHADKGVAGANGQAPPAAAVCEDASAPTLEADGSYSCADGSEPVCANGAEPVSVSGGSGPVCPVASAGAAAGECEGAAAAAGASADASCEDGSQPECEDGSRPTLAEDGWTLECPGSGEYVLPSEASSPYEGGSSYAELSGEGTAEGLSALLASGS
jgi:hypothetical protein